MRNGTSSKLLRNVQNTISVNIWLSRFGLRKNCFVQRQRCVTAPVRTVMSNSEYRTTTEKALLTEMDHLLLDGSRSKIKLCVNAFSSFTTCTEIEGRKSHKEMPRCGVLGPCNTRWPPSAPQQTKNLWSCRMFSSLKRTRSQFTIVVLNWRVEEWFLSMGVMKILYSQLQRDWACDACVGYGPVHTGRESRFAC